MVARYRLRFRRKYLQKMLAEETLKMTIPDKPSSGIKNTVRENYLNHILTKMVKI